MCCGEVIMSKAEEGVSEQTERFKETARTLGYDEGEAPLHENLKIIAKKSLKNSKRTDVIQGVSDQEYVLRLCDGVLGQTGHREHKFDFLVSDPGKNGSVRRLPVDAFYESLNLVIEYQEKQHTEPVSFFDKPDRMTVSGVHRGEQRKRYDQRRREVFCQTGITLMELSYSDFDHNAARRLKRKPAQDEAVVRHMLASFVPPRLTVP